MELSKLARGGTLESPRRHDPDIPGLEEEAATDLLHVLLEDDGAVFPVRDCLYDEPLRQNYTVTLVLISAPPASWHES